MRYPIHWSCLKYDFTICPRMFCFYSALIFSSPSVSSSFLSFWLKVHLLILSMNIDAMEVVCTYHLIIRPLFFYGQPYFTPSHGGSRKLWWITGSWAASDIAVLYCYQYCCDAHSRRDLENDRCLASVQIMNHEWDRNRIYALSWVNVSLLSTNSVKGTTPQSFLWLNSFGRFERRRWWNFFYLIRG